MVFDKAGKFVEGLKPEQFELRVDGKLQSVSFFDRIAAGTFDEEAQLAAARGRSRSDKGADAIVRPLDRGRTFIFYLDDVHVSPGNFARMRETLLRFVDQEMGQNDEAAIFTTTGQLGFLQQMTSDKTVLRIAIKRLAPRYFDTRDTDRTPMTEFQALAIERNDRAVFDYFVDQVIKELNLIAPRVRGVGGRGRAASGGGGQVAQAEGMVRARARNLLTQANFVTKSTLSSLENVVRRGSELPGRKLLIFISDGFFLNTQDSTSHDDVRRIADAAAHTGTIIYSIDSRGLTTGLPEAGTKVAFDPGNQLGSANANEFSASQEPLHTLAVETGGRAMFYLNDTTAGFTEAARETSHYYLLAWRPEGEMKGVGKFHQIEVKIKDRPDLVVRMRRGFSDEAAQKAEDKSRSKSSKKDKKNPVDEELMSALKALYPKRALPTSLSAGFTDTPDAGATLTASIEVDGKALGFGADGKGDNATLDVVGAVVDDQGKAISEFEQNLTVTPLQLTQASRRRVVYNHQMQLKPGLYQVRTAARDRKSGRSGSAMQWIEVPDTKKTGFSLSSVFIGETGVESSGQLSICADHRFARSSRMGFMLYVYNAARPSASAPDVALQVQILRDDQPVVTKPLLKIDTGGMPDLTRLPYGEEISLASLPAGRYVLQVTAIDRTAKASASQRVNFIIE
jgi:VWFA-related protein